MTTKSTVKKSTTTKVVVKSPASVVEFVNNPWQELVLEDLAINKWIQSNCGGDPMNVLVVPLEGMERHDFFDDSKPVGERRGFPFGYRRVPGTRALYHDWHAYGVDGDLRLGTILKAMKAMDKHDTKKMMCTVALLNGGYSRSQKTWGKAFIKLVYVPPKA